MSSNSDPPQEPYPRPPQPPVASYAAPAYPEAQPPSYPPPPPPQSYAPGYPVQPGYYAPMPGYYPQPYPPQLYGGQPGYYAPTYPAPPQESGVATIAGIMWLICLIRDLFALVVLLFVSAIPFFTLGFGAAAAVLALFPLIGIIGCVIAMSSDFSRKSHGAGTLGGILALVGSSFPGVIFIGPVGLIFAVVGLILHLTAKKDFAS